MPFCYKHPDYWHVIDEETKRTGDMLNSRKLFDDSEARVGGISLLEKAFATDEYSKEDLQYVVDVLRHCSRKTLWRTFDSCNNYRVPEPVSDINTQIHYWCAKMRKRAETGYCLYETQVSSNRIYKIAGLGTWRVSFTET